MVITLRSHITGITALYVVGALTTLAAYLSSKSDSLREKSKPVHNVRFVEPVVDSFHGSFYMLPVVDYRGRKSLALAHPTQIVFDNTSTKKGPVMLDDDQKQGNTFIRTPEIVDFLVGDMIEGVEREKVEGSDLGILRPRNKNPLDTRWDDQFSVDYVSNVSFMGKYSDIITLHRSDDGGEVRLIDQGRDGIVDYIHLYGYFGRCLKNELLDLNTPEFNDAGNILEVRTTSQREITEEKDRLVRLVEAEHHSCPLKYKGCKHNTSNQ